MDLSVIIVSWNCGDKLQANLSSLLKSEGLSFEIFVVDNASIDGTADMVRRDFPQVHLLANDDNLGFARANNQALRLAGGDFLLLLNPDMLVDGQTLAKAVAWLRAKPEAMVAGFKLLDQQGKVIKHVRRFPTLADQLAIVLKIPHFLPKTVDRYIQADFNYEQEQSVDSVRGSFFFIRRVALEQIGYLDERFFVWFEEVDYCRRVKQAGGQVWYSPVASAVDLVGQSFKQLSRVKAQRYFRDSQLKYFAKWRPRWESNVLRVAWLVSKVMVWLAEIFKIKTN